MHIVEVLPVSWECNCGEGDDDLLTGAQASRAAYAHAERNTPSQIRDMRRKPVEITNL